MNDASWWERRGPLAAAILGGALVVVIAAFLLWMGPFAPPAGEPPPSPTSAAPASPSPDVSPSPQPTISPEPSPELSPSPQPTLSPEPSPSPTIAPRPSPPPPASPTPAPPTGWIEITDFPTYRGPTSVASVTAGGPGFVAVGDGGRQQRGRIWTSIDGQRWTAQPDAQFAGFFLRKVVRVDGQLFAFGRDQRGTRVWRSADGSNWTQLAESAEFVGAGVNDVAVAGATMVAVGSTQEPDYEGAVWRSTNGVDWQRVASPESIDDDGLWAVAARGSTIVGFPRWHVWRGSLIVYSNNLGDSWQAAEVDLALGEDFGAGLVGLAVSGDRFVAVGYYELDGFVPIALTSRDGSSWTSVMPQAADTLGELVALPDGTLVAFEAWYGARSAGALVSTDGQAWRMIEPLYTNQQPPVPPEGGDEFVTKQAAATSGAGVVVAVEWGDNVRVWFGPSSLFR